MMNAPSAYDEIETILRNYEGRTFGFASRNFYVAFLAAVQVDQNYEDYFGPLTFEEAAQTAVIEIPVPEFWMVPFLAKYNLLLVRSK